MSGMLWLQQLCTMNYILQKQKNKYWSIYSHGNWTNSWFMKKKKWARKWKKTKKKWKKERKKKEERKKNKLQKWFVTVKHIPFEGEVKRGNSNILDNDSETNKKCLDNETVHADPVANFRPNGQLYIIQYIFGQCKILILFGINTEKQYWLLLLAKEKCTIGSKNKLNKCVQFPTIADLPMTEMGPSSHSRL